MSLEKKVLNMGEDSGRDDYWFYTLRTQFCLLSFQAHSPEFDNLSTLYALGRAHEFSEHSGIDFF